MADEQTPEQEPQTEPEAGPDMTEGGAAHPAGGSGAVHELDVEALLQPISEDAPAGEDLRYDPVYDTVKEARREDDPTLPVGVWETDLKRAEWAVVKNTCEEALRTRTKDVQLAAWLTEALLRRDGFAGLRQGLALILGLCERFWETMYPEWREDDPEYRLGPFRWINDKLYLRLKLVSITHPQTHEAKAYTYGDWEAANQLEQLQARDKNAFVKAEKQGKVTRAKFLGSVTFTGKAFYKALRDDLQECLRLLGLLEGLLDERCGPHSPSLVQFRETLQAVEQVAGKLLGEKRQAEPAAQEEETMSDSQGEPGGGGQAPPLSTGTIGSRAEAYRALSEAADFLMITEPHSPTPYLVKRAVTWGNLTLTELLEEIVSNKDDLDNIFVLLGLKDRRSTQGGG